MLFLDPKRLARKARPLVTKEEIAYLERAEQKEAQKRGRSWFKFSTDEAMLSAVEGERSQAGNAAA